MLKLTLTSILIISSACAHAQAEAFIYPKTIDYIEKTPVASNLIIEPRSRGSIIAGGGAEYKIYSPYDNNINKKLKKEYFLVERNDSLFVNCHYLRDKWYSLSFFRNERYIFFVSGPSSLMNNNGAVVGAGLMFGLVGGAMAGMAQAGAKYNYVIDLVNRKYYFADPKYMKEIFGDTELYQRYRKEQYPYSTEVLLKYLEEFYQ